MNNILTFEDYRKMNIRQVESVIYRQFIEEDIKSEINEGFIRNTINKAYANKFVKNALADEIEKGKELEKNIKEALDALNAGIDEIGKTMGSENGTPDDSDSSAAKLEIIKESIKSVQSQTFDTLTMLGSEGEIDFAGFMGSASVAAAMNFGILFSPIRSVFMTRKAYKYFLAIIKQTIRRNLLIIQLNFDQFENLILQKSFETDNDSEISTMSETLNNIIFAMQRELVGKDSKLKFTGKKGEEMRKYLSNFKETQNALIRQHKEDTRNNPLSSLWQDQHNNTYTRTLEQIKQYINEDSQKELDALKNSITKMSGNDVDLTQYGELLMSAAEEYAVHTNHGINNNFIKMSSVFNLENQKKLIELIDATQKENEAEAKKKREDLEFKDKEKEMEEDIKEGKKLYEEKLKDSTTTYTIDTFDKEFSNKEIEQLAKFFTTEDGQKAYKELVEKNPLYKYLFGNDIAALNNLYSSLNDLKIFEISSIPQFYENVVEKEQAIYYSLSEKYIKNAVESINQKEYLGFNFKGKLDTDNIYIEKTLNAKSNMVKHIVAIDKSTPKYFLTFSGNGNNLFNILHKDFKTNLFEESGEFTSDISLDSKKDIIKIINKELKIGNSISTTLAEYLVRMEAHMLLREQKDWYVPFEEKDGSFKIECFKPNTDKILNKLAFVVISSKDYEDIKRFLNKFHSLAEKDFIEEVETKEEK
jgi:hypothetical protein